MTSPNLEIFKNFFFFVKLTYFLRVKTHKIYLNKFIILFLTTDFKRRDVIINQKTYTVDISGKHRDQGVTKV